jgi:type IV pilus assembly protein PilB
MNRHIDADRFHRTMVMKQRKRLGEVLKDAGHIESSELERVVEEQRGKAVRLGELLLERNLIRKEDLIPALEESTHYKYVDCQQVPVSDEALKAVPVQLAKKHCLLPMYIEDGKLAVAMSSPQSLNAIDELQFATGKLILPHLGFERDIKAAIVRWYGEDAEAGNESEQHKSLQLAESDLGALEFLTLGTAEANLEAHREMEAERRKQRTPATQVVSSILAAAVIRKASDVHIDPQERKILVRLRVDGMMQDLMELPREQQGSVVSRIKILADMDIAERRVPQDGRFLLRFRSEKIDLRAATLPTQHGEKIVIRLLDPKATRVSFADLGIPTAGHERITEVLAKPQGMLLVVGPTGSGKTTTLYAAINCLRSRPVNIITVEDPVEYVLEGINQVQVNQKSGRSFANSLRSILRQDPNVIMVGEIRDAETAEIALTASQTGHLLLSTLHTNDSVSAITRLIDLNIPPFLVASSITGIIAQRLVRRLCSCAREVEIPFAYAMRLQEAGIYDHRTTAFAPVGCRKCDHNGYKGRLGVYEILVSDEEIRNLIRCEASPDQIREQARSAGMRLLQEEAFEKVQMGLTSLEEVFRVIPFSAGSSTQCVRCRRMLSPEFVICPFCGTTPSLKNSRHQSKSSATSCTGGNRP